jgi:hypothetical protein
MHMQNATFETGLNFWNTQSTCRLWKCSVLGKTTVKEQSLFFCVWGRIWKKYSQCSVYLNGCTEMTSSCKGLFLWRLQRHRVVSCACAVTRVRGVLLRGSFYPWNTNRLYRPQDKCIALVLILLYRDVHKFLVKSLF